jgi:hypothetical protein
MSTDTTYVIGCEYQYHTLLSDHGLYDLCQRQSSLHPFVALQHNDVRLEMSQHLQDAFPHQSCDEWEFSNYGSLCSYYLNDRYEHAWNPISPSQ